MSKLLVVALGCFLLNGIVYGADSSCDAQAAEKKLSGAAKNSFVKKCQKDASASTKTACEGQAGDKRLSGAAKNSFVKKCEKDTAATK